MNKPSRPHAGPQLRRVLTARAAILRQHGGDLALQLLESLTREKTFCGMGAAVRTQVAADPGVGARRKNRAPAPAIAPSLFEECHMTTNSNPLDAAYRAALAARAEARARLAAAAQAELRAERLENAAREKVAGLAATIEAGQAERAAELRDWITAGVTENEPPARGDAKNAHALKAAQDAAEIADRALSALRATHELRRVEAERAGATVIATVERIIVAEAEAIAAEIEHHEAQAVSLREQLLPLLPPSRPRGSPIFSSAAVCRALEPPGMMTTSRYLPMLGENGPHRQRIVAHSKTWDARRAALIAGEASDAPRTEEQAA
jgi:hypothetical protein